MRPSRELRWASMRWERRSPPIEQGEIPPVALKRATQRTALAMLTPKRLAAALRDMPPSTTALTTRWRRSSESAIPAASFARRRSGIRTQVIRESLSDSLRSDTALVVISALTNAERRGVAIRIVLDPRERHDFVKLGDLSDNVRIKRGGPFMHLKAYSVDGEMLRTGSANFSTSGGGAFVSRDVSATWRNFQRGAWGNRARPPEPPLPVVGDFPNDFQTLIHK